MRNLLLFAWVLLLGCTSAPDWSRHDAHRLCGPAIDAWPSVASPPCAALHMCANEARLTAAQSSTLHRMLEAEHCDGP